MLCGHRCTMVCHTGLCATGESCKKKITLRCPCKRIKKEMQCSTQQKKVTVLSCDDECITIQEKLKAEELENYLKSEEEEKKKQEQELQEFLRKTEGRKRKKKKISNEIDSSPKYTKYIISAIIILCIIGFLLFFLSIL